MRYATAEERPTKPTSVIQDCPVRPKGADPLFYLAAHAAHWGGREQGLCPSRKGARKGQPASAWQECGGEVAKRMSGGEAAQARPRLTSTSTKRALPVIGAMFLLGEDTRSSHPFLPALGRVNRRVAKRIASKPAGSVENNAKGVKGWFAIWPTMKLMC